MGGEARTKVGVFTLQAGQTGQAFIPGGFFSGFGPEVLMLLGLLRVAGFWVCWHAIPFGNLRLDLSTLS
jgi:hypothetical protein